MLLLHFEAGTLSVLFMCMCWHCVAISRLLALARAEYLRGIVIDVLAVGFAGPGTAESQGE